MMRSVVETRKIQAGSDSELVGTGWVIIAEFILMILASGLIGCSTMGLKGGLSRDAVQTEYTSSDPRELCLISMVRRDSFHSLKAKAALKYRYTDSETGKTRESGATAIIRYSAPGSMRIDLMVPIAGRLMATWISTPDTFFVYDWRERRIVVSSGAGDGSAGAGSYGFLPETASSGIISGVLLPPGDLWSPDDAQLPLSLDDLPSDERAGFSIKWGDVIYSSFFTGDLSAVEEAFITDSGGSDVLLHVRFRWGDSPGFPEGINILSPPSGEEIDLEFREVKADCDVAQSIFSIPGADEGS